MPFGSFVGFAVLEVLGAPLYVWWQTRVAQAAGALPLPLRRAA